MFIPAASRRWDWLPTFGISYYVGVDGVSLRIARVYGPYRRANCHLGSLIRDAAAGRATEIPCDNDFIYHYVYVDDAGEAIATALEAQTLPDREYNVGAGEAFTMPEIARIAAATIEGAKPVLVPGADDVPDVQTEFDIAKIGRDLGWKPRFDLAAGITDYRHHIEAGDAA